MEIKRKGKQEILMLRQAGAVPYLSCPALDAHAEIVHGFSTRYGGVSTEHLSSMNLSFSRGDAEEHVRENFKRIAESIGFDQRNLVFSHQTHTNHVRVATEEDRGNGFAKPLPYTDVDGLVTNIPGLVLATFYADCVPLFLVDPVHRAVGLSHSGWKGTVNKIGKVTVDTMVRQYGSDPADLIAVIGPSICLECYEVSEDVIEEFRMHYRKEAWSSIFYRKENGKYQLNLWKANELVFLEAGIRPEQISVTDICTCCNPDLLYSHRASKGMRGNLAAFLGIRE